MPPKGWKKPLAGKAKVEPEQSMIAPREAFTVSAPDSIAPLPSMNRFTELMRNIPESAFVQMACSSGMQRDQIRELCELFRKLKV